VVGIYNADCKNFDYEPEDYLKDNQICVQGKLV